MIAVIDRPTIQVKEISFQLIDKGNEKDKIDEFSLDIGRYPYVEIGKLPVQSDQIIILQLFNDQFLPRLQMQFRDTSGQLIDPLFPIDDTIIKLFIQADSDILMPVRMDFKVTKINPIKSKSGDNYDIIFSLDGILDISYLYGTQYVSYKDTSYNVIHTIAKNSGLGFASNVDGTNDSMVWINPAEQYMDFIQDVVTHSYRSRNSFMFAYVDFYYNLNYVDIEVALSEDIDDQKGSAGNNYFFDTAKKKEEVTSLVLTNHPDRITTNLYIDKYDLVNKSTEVNLDIGYLYYLSYYDTSGNLLYRLILDNISTTGKDNSNIIMKGGIGEVTELSLTSADGSYAGALDIDNMHEYYFYAKYHNENNLRFLQKVKLKVTLQKANFNLYRFQKVKINFYKTNQLNENDVVGKNAYTVDEKEAKENAGKIKDDDKLNQRLSGEWLITAISYAFNKRSGFEQEVTLAKRELSFNESDFDPQKAY